MKLLIASNNKHKITEIRQILQNHFEEIFSLEDLRIECDPDETGETFLENALIKANEIAKHTSYAVLADDTGLCVTALGGAPGVYSARYAGSHESAKNRQKLLCELQNATDRTAYFESCVVLRYPDGTTVTASGKVDGYILTEEIGDKSFGYDCLFYAYDIGKCFGQATSEEKNSVSHRGRALQNLLQKLN